MSKVVNVPHDRLFGGFDPEMTDVGHAKPDAEKILGRLRKAGKLIRITGPITESELGRRLLVGELYSQGLPFDEIENE